MKKITFSMVAIMGAVLLNACQSTNQIDLAGYAPVIDHYQYDQNQYLVDLAQCRQIGIVAQAKYQQQREKEQQNQLAAALIGTAIGAAVGNRVDSGDDSGTTVGALYGAAIGSSVGADQVDYSRIIAKFGPTEIVDRCMRGRGYALLSNEGLGGG